MEKKIYIDLIRAPKSLHPIEERKKNFRTKARSELEMLKVTRIIEKGTRI